MRSASLIIFLVILLSGCAAYKFHHGEPPYDKGYVVSRDSYTILEYTLGKDNSVPNRKLAKERFNRRRLSVEDYYKKMGNIENRFKMAFLDPAIMMLKLAGGICRLPFIAVSDYRYEHDPKYREKIKAMEQAQDAKEEGRINKLKEELNSYIQKDLAAEPTVASTVSPVNVVTHPAKRKSAENKTQKKERLLERKAQAEKRAIEKMESKKLKEEKKAGVLAAKQLRKEAAIHEEKQGKNLSQEIKAVIIAKPERGLSPLKVHFYADRSFSLAGKIVSYSWDFGDTDTSSKIDPINIYYSGSSEPRYFTVSLTVKDSKGNTATSTKVIEVLNK